MDFVVRNSNKLQKLGVIYLFILVNMHQLPLPVIGWVLSTYCLVIGHIYLELIGDFFWRFILASYDIKI
jgi:hypothetical protein